MKTDQPLNSSEEDYCFNKDSEVDEDFSFRIGGTVALARETKPVRGVQQAKKSAGKESWDQIYEIIEDDSDRTGDVAEIMSDTAGNLARYLEKEVKDGSAPRKFWELSKLQGRHVWAYPAYVTGFSAVTTGQRFFFQDIEEPLIPALGVIAALGFGAGSIMKGADRASQLNEYLDTTIKNYREAEKKLEEKNSSALPESFSVSPAIYDRPVGTTDIDFYFYEEEGDWKGEIQETSLSEGFNTCTNAVQDQGKSLYEIAKSFLE